MRRLIHIFEKPPSVVIKGTAERKRTTNTVLFKTIQSLGHVLLIIQPSLENPTEVKTFIYFKPVLSQWTRTNITAVETNLRRFLRENLCSSRQPTTECSLTPIRNKWRSFMHRDQQHHSRHTSLAQYLRMLLALPISCRHTKQHCYSMLVTIQLADHFY